MSGDRPGVTPSTRHLVAVWNPSYASDAIEEHLAVLLRLAAARRSDGRMADEDVYVWWGRVHSPNRLGRLPNTADVEAIERLLSDDASEPPETHLYLTDYQSLYVAELGEIHFGPLPDDERTHVPGYYREQRLECDYWFKLWDIRGLVAGDLPGTIGQLRLLRNVHYQDKPVSLYGGMVDLPLVVTRADEASFFDQDDRDCVTDGRLWAELDAETGAGMLSVERSLRDDLLGESTWTAFDPAVRTFIATAEKIYRDRRSDPAFDFAAVLTPLSKALEVHVGALLRDVSRKLPRRMRYVNVGGRSEDLATYRPRGLHELVEALAGEKERASAIAESVHNGGWFTTQLPAVLEGFRTVRNDGTHELRIDRRVATHWRNQLLGVGCMGHFVELGKVKAR